MGKKYESEVLKVCHQSAESLFRLGIIDAEEMKEFDEGCLIQEPKKTNKAKNFAEMEYASRGSPISAS